MIKTIRLVPVSVYAEKKQLHKTSVYDKINKGELTVYELPVKKIGEKPKRYLNPEE